MDAFEMNVIMKFLFYEFMSSNGIESEKKPETLQYNLNTVTNKISVFPRQKYHIDYNLQRHNKWTFGKANVLYVENRERITSFHISQRNSF